MSEKTVSKFENSDTFICYMPVNFGGFDLVVYECGYEQCDPLHFWGPGKKTYYMFHYCLSGKGSVDINGRHYKIEAGDGFFLDPQTTAYYVADEKEPWEYIWVCFGGNFVKSILERMSVSIENPVFSDTEDQVIRARFEEMRNSAHSDIVSHLSALGNLYSLLAELVAHYPSKKKDTHRDRDIFEKAMKIVQSEFTRVIGIDDLARRVGFSRSNLYRIFKKNTGVGPLEYIERLRIAYACELIKQNKLYLTEIARFSGFGEYKAFCKTFQRIIGVPPGKFLTAVMQDNYVYDKNRQLIAEISLWNESRLHEEK